MWRGVPFLVRGRGLLCGRPPRPQGTYSVSTDGGNASRKAPPSSNWRWREDRRYLKLPRKGLETASATARVFDECHAKRDLPVDLLLEQDGRAGPVEGEREARGHQRAVLFALDCVLPHIKLADGNGGG